jgi:prolyl-tRNA editing enzyme YbaK/EbsC (Cys-tRNA(Pro) deacylase)
LSIEASRFIWSDLNFANCLCQSVRRCWLRIAPEIIMSLESVRAFLAEHAPDIAVIELEGSTATVALAAEGHGVSHGQIAKTLSLRQGDKVFLLVTRGDARLDNKKARAAFGGKVSMLSPQEVVAVTGHPVGGVCPFGLKSPLPVYCDISLRAFEEVVPAAGSTTSAMRIDPLRIAELTGAQWVDVCADLPPL